MVEREGRCVSFSDNISEFRGHMATEADSVAITPIRWLFGAAQNLNRTVSASLKNNVLESRGNTATHADPVMIRHQCK